jgi:IstB-like ATP binding protein
MFLLSLTATCQVWTVSLKAGLFTYNWHEALGNPTLADAILDRLVHNAYQIALRGESMRKRSAKGLPQAVVE